MPPPVRWFLPLVVSLAPLLPLTAGEAEPTAGQPGPAVLTASGTVFAQPDQLHLRLRITTTDKSLTAALRGNEQARVALVESMVKAGIPSAQVVPDRFATNTQRGPPAEKSKTTTVASEVTCIATSEAQAQTVASVAEARADCVVVDLYPEDSQRAERERQALKQALVELDLQREVVEKGLGVSLRPCGFAREPWTGRVQPFSPPMGGKGSGSSFSTSSFSYADKNSGQPSILDPGSWNYQADVRVTYDVIVSPGKE